MQFFQRLYKRNILCMLWLFLSPVYGYANPTFPFCAPQFDLETQSILTQIYHAKTIPSALPDRIQYFSQLFLNKPYTLTALGEGAKAEFDQGPLYRFDAFDCQTYVETVLALSLANSPQTFQQRINQIRYAHAKVEYTQRHHFTSPDWNAYNQKLGLLRDITSTIQDSRHVPIARYATATIDPANWYQHFTQDKIRLCDASDDLQQQRLGQLRQRGRTLSPKISHIAYLPIQALTTKDKASHDLLDQIPSGAIIEIIRPNWDLTQAIGTHLNVSHIGFAIREHGILYFYQASSLENKVNKLPLEDYLSSMLSKPTIQGINVQVVS